MSYRALDDGEGDDAGVALSSSHHPTPSPSASPAPAVVAPATARTALLRDRAHSSGVSGAAAAAAAAAIAAVNASPDALSPSALLRSSENDSSDASDAGGAAPRATWGSAGASSNGASAAAAAASGVAPKEKARKTAPGSKKGGRASRASATFASPRQASLHTLRAIAKPTQTAFSDDESSSDDEDSTDENEDAQLTNRTKPSSTKGSARGSTRGSRSSSRRNSLTSVQIVDGSGAVLPSTGERSLNSTGPSVVEAPPSALEIPPTPQQQGQAANGEQLASAVPLSNRRHHSHAKSSGGHSPSPRGADGANGVLVDGMDEREGSFMDPERELLDDDENGSHHHHHHGHHHKDASSSGGSALSKIISKDALFGVPWRTIGKRIPYYVPVLGWAPKYSVREYLPYDMFAGMTLGIMLVPQGLTYAVLANLPPVHGLYVAFFPLLVYTLLGSSRHLSVGPEVTSAILIGKAIMQFPGIPSGDISDPLVSEALVEASIALTFTVGVMSLLLGLTRLGFLDSILSRPMLAGFVNAVALTLICEQLPTLLGMTTSCGSACAPGTSPFDIFIHVITHMGQTHWQTLMVALCCCTFMFGAQAVKGRFPHLRAVVCFPDVLVVVVAATFVSWAADLPSKGVVVFGHLTAGFRKPQLPSFQHVDASQLITSALTISLLGFVESMLISKKYASKHAYVISPNRELVALGAGSVVGSMFGSFTAFGSIPRTKISDSAGVKSQLGNFVAASVVLMVIVWLLPHFSSMPKASSASIILVVAISLFEFEEIRFVVRTKQWVDLTLNIGMLLVTFFLGVDVGIAFAFICCLLMAVKQTTLPLVTMLGRGSADDDFHDVGDLDEDVAQVEGLLIYKLEGVLFFANAEKLKDSTRRAETQGAFHVHPSEEASPMAITSVVFELSALTAVDASALMILHEILESYRERSARVCFVKLRKSLRPVFEAAGLIDLVGKENMFKKLENAVAHVQGANLNNLAHDPAIVLANEVVLDEQGKPIVDGGNNNINAAAAPAGASAAADIGAGGQVARSASAAGSGSFRLSVVSSSSPRSGRAAGGALGKNPSLRRKKSLFFAPPTTGSPLLRNLAKLKI